MEVLLRRVGQERSRDPDPSGTERELAERDPRGAGAPGRPRRADERPRRDRAAGVLPRVLAHDPVRRVAEVRVARGVIGPGWAHVVAERCRLVRLVPVVEGLSVDGGLTLG